MNVTFELPADAQQRLRELRLWHWRKVRQYRGEQQSQETQVRACQSLSHKSAWQRLADDAKSLADMHLGFVQALNDFFPIGDTAEKDDES